jgi:hypothetical protein
MKEEKKMKVKKEKLIGEESLESFLSANKHLRLPTNKELDQWDMVAEDIHYWCADIYTAEVGLYHDGKFYDTSEPGAAYYAIFLEKEKEEKMEEQKSGRPDVSHYKGKIEVIDFIHAHDLNFNRGNVVKYTVRAGKKDPSKEIEDLRKAIDYLNFEIERIKTWK